MFAAGPNMFGMPAYGQGAFHPPWQQSGGWQQSGTSSDAYVEKVLRPADEENYTAAGLIPYRKKNGVVELLLPREKPWNSFINGYDPLAWSTLGGKRVMREDRSADATAVRCFLEAVGDAPGCPTQGQVYDLLADSFYLWYPLGKFALILAEVTDGSLDDFPSKFASHKEGRPSEEQQTLSSGMKKWRKQVESLEWVPGSKLVPEPRFEVSDLFGGMLKLSRFADILTGKLDPAEAWPKGSYQPRQQSADSGGNGKGKNKGKGWGKGKEGKGKGKDGGKGGMMKSFGKMAPQPYAGKGMAMMHLAPPMPAPMYTSPAPPFQQGSEEMQRQMYGEQLYVLVLPMAPSPYLAQKITGMLLELPTDELILSLQSRDELSRRVEEAMEVLKEDGLTD
eukprot:TRINITY_DN23998_c0_g1_i1.p1 TRINITY_DN23998_c0_g1~~TRINITY_DN23998_c0_g1_i1.p1  ORF type:complete len:393 (+),score=98.52 TRINITY_DN23998_c0_g1_i1:86-1264(+)